MQMTNAVLTKEISFRDLNGTLQIFPAGQPIKVVSSILEQEHITIDGTCGHETDDGYVAEMSNGDLVDIHSDEFKTLLQ